MCMCSYNEYFRCIPTASHLGEWEWWVTSNTPWDDEGPDYHSVKEPTGLYTIYKRVGKTPSGSEV
jgi:hypothetical protein